MVSIQAKDGLFIVQQVTDFSAEQQEERKRI